MMTEVSRLRRLYEASLHAALTLAPAPAKPQASPRRRNSISAWGASMQVKLAGLAAPE